jgi:divalent metal cation (Fe/Co/Zn/Cd) transporter
MHDLDLEPAPGGDVRAGLVASSASIVWTAVTSALAIALGINARSVALVAFGAVGLFDMAGSAALVVHFRHALRHDVISHRHEHIAHLVVSYGMLTVGIATLIASVYRLTADSHASASLTGLVTSAASILALGYLGTSKRRIGRRIPSQALATDGALSLIGCGTATFTVAGLGLNNAFGWSWVDPAAAMIIAVTAIALATVSLRRAD